MINERIAIVMLDGEIPGTENDPHHTKQFYKSIRSFANASLKLSEEEKFRKLQDFLNVALKLFKEGNETVKNGITNVYLYTLSNSLDQQPKAITWIVNFLPSELRNAYIRLHYASGI